jgi:hypothetical protein
MNNPFGFEVGQEVYIQSDYRNYGRRVPIVRMGRSLFYVTIYGREVAFRIEDGYERTTASSIGSPDRAMTAEMVEAEERQKTAVSNLMGVGVRFSGPLPAVEVLEQMLAAIRGTTTVEWGIEHNQGVATMRSEAGARLSLPGFLKQYHTNFRNTFEPVVVSRLVTNWTPTPEQKEITS